MDPIIIRYHYCHHCPYQPSSSFSPMSSPAGVSTKRTTSCLGINMIYDKDDTSKVANRRGRISTTRLRHPRSRTSRLSAGNSLATTITSTNIMSNPRSIRTAVITMTVTLLLIMSGTKAATQTKRTSCMASSLSTGGRYAWYDDEATETRKGTDRNKGGGVGGGSRRWRSTRLAFYSANFCFQFLTFYFLPVPLQPYVWSTCFALSFVWVFIG